jgi:hypothetical protein
MDGVVVNVAALPPLLQIAFLSARANEFHEHRDKYLKGSPALNLY